MKEEKVADILNYSASRHYTDKEKVLLDLAFAAGMTPNKSTKSHFDNLKKHFSKKEIIDIVSVIALFGFLNRWNDTMGTVLEEIPENFVENKLKPLGWS
jgi:alkylhydroperoxidase family enzyme